MEQPKDKKKRFNSKGKGNGFEGTVAKKLTAALAPLNFIRTPGSGARVGGKNFETIGQMFGEEALKIFVGDVVPVNERKEGFNFKHSIECKSYSTPDNFTSLVSNTANVFKWFDEAAVDACKIDKSPMLIFKWNRTAIFVAVDTLDVRADYRVLTENGVKPRLTLLAAGISKSIDVYYLDDLLPIIEFWYSKV